MNETIDSVLASLSETGNMRHIPADTGSESAIDLSSNDYLGLATDQSLREEFMATDAFRSLPMSASASRLLAGCQQPYHSLESTLSATYGSPTLLFNSGYHANTGIVSALGSLKGTYIIADRLVHASIIDGIKLSGAEFTRFRHNDYEHLGRLAAKAKEKYNNILIIAESVYSMDGDCCDVPALIEIKKVTPGAILYIDEAHAVGVEGPGGLGLVKASNPKGDVDIIIGTFGKALASVGAYAVVNDRVRQFLVNKARSFIFSTALPPLSIAWSEFIFKHMLGMDSERKHLKSLGLELSKILNRLGEATTDSHIQPLVAGNPEKAIEWSNQLHHEGVKVLPIRTPTVPPGTDRLRFSLSAAMSMADMGKVAMALQKIY